MAYPGDLLLHPVPIVALIVVVANDRFIKVHHPGVISGKLSDFAGLVYFPLFIVTLVELVRWIVRPRSSSLDSWSVGPRAVDVIALITGVIFTFAKLWGPGADAYRVVFGVVWWPFDAFGSLVGGHGWPPLGRLGLTQDASDLIALPALLLPMFVARRVDERRSVLATRRAKKDRKRQV